MTEQVRESGDMRNDRSGRDVNRISLKHVFPDIENRVMSMGMIYELFYGE